MMAVSTNGAGEARMSDSRDPKTWWSLPECVTWICTRDHDHVEALADVDPLDAAGLVMVRYSQGWLVRPRRAPPEANAAKEPSTPRPDGLDGGAQADPTSGDGQGAASIPSADAQTGESDPYEYEPASREGLVIMPSSEALDQLFEGVRRCRVKLMGRRVDDDRFEQVQPFELNAHDIDAPGAAVKDLFDHLAPIETFTALFNGTGQPAMSLPLCWSKSGLPLGMQLVGRFGDEATLFRLAGALEQALPWHNRRPPVHIAD